MESKLGTAQAESQGHTQQSSGYDILILNQERGLFQFPLLLR